MPNASLNSVRELDAATLDQIRQACREQTEKLDETEANKDQKDDDQHTELPPPGPKTEINQKYQSSTDPEATLVRQHGFKTRPRYKTTGWSMTPRESLRRLGPRPAFRLYARWEAFRVLIGANAHQE